MATPSGADNNTALLFLDGARLASWSGLQVSAGTTHLLSTYRDPTSFVGWGYPSTWRKADGTGWRTMYQGWQVPRRACARSTASVPLEVDSGSRARVWALTRASRWPWLCRRRYRQCPCRHAPYGTKWPGLHAAGLPCLRGALAHDQHGAAPEPGRRPA